MKSFRWAAIGVAAAAVLAACGGSDDNKVNFTQTVSFGDSVSDVGTYQVGTVAALGGGKFTVNGPAGKVWTEDLAAAVGTPAQCAARTGLLPNDPQVTGAPVQDFPNCFNYAEGSARVTSEGSGPNGVALQQSLGQVNIGLMRDIWMDYIKPVGLRLALDIFTIAWLVGCTGWAIQVLWRL